MKKWRFWLLAVVLLAIMLLVFWNNGVNHVFPLEYRFSKERTIVRYPTKTTIYKIRGDVNIDNLKNYPTCYDDDYMIQKWVDLNNQNEDLRDYIESYIRIDIIGFMTDRTPSKELETVLDNLSSFYFSGYYSMMKGHGNEKYKRYEDFYLLDIKNKKLYRFKEIKGF